MKRITYAMVTLFMALVANRGMTDTFGIQSNSFEIEFVTIGDPGNAADTAGLPSGVGSVPYAYRIGKYEISEQMIDKANAVGGLGITKDTRSPNKPATSVSWFEAAKFVNWLNTSAGISPAYKFDGMGRFQVWQPSDPGYDPDNLFRNSRAAYFLPSVDEWYKAAYFDPANDIYYNFPTGSDSAPLSVASGTTAGTAVYGQLGPADITLAGGLSPYGTMAQGGNVAEWNETGFDLPRSANFGPVRRGGDFAHPQNELRSTEGNQYGPNSESLETGFRVGSVVPEPKTITVLIVSLFGVPILRLRRLNERRRHDA